MNTTFWITFVIVSVIALLYLMYKAGGISECPENCPDWEGGCIKCLEEGKW